MDNLGSFPVPAIQGEHCRAGPYSTSLPRLATDCGCVRAWLGKAFPCLSHVLGLIIMLMICIAKGAEDGLCVNGSGSLILGSFFLSELPLVERAS